MHEDGISSLPPPHGNDGVKQVADSNHQRYGSFISVIAAIEGADEQLLPASFHALELDLGFHPSTLGYLSLAQASLNSLMCPVWGYFADRYPRKWLMVAGTACWGMATSLLGLVTTFWGVIGLRGINGAALGSVGPIAQSLLSDMVPANVRGSAFGIIQLYSCLGKILGGVFTTYFSTQIVFGQHGWRICFLGIGVISLLVSLLLSIFMQELPRRQTKSVSNQASHESSYAKQAFNHISSGFIHIYQSPVIRPLVIESIFGVIPWSTFSFNILYFRYCGFDAIQSATVLGLFLAFSGIGGGIGGFIGDFLHEYSPKHGRPLLGQIAMVLRCPIVIVAFGIIEPSSDAFMAYCIIFCALGLTSVAGAAVNRPILTECTDPEHRAMVFGLIVAIEGVFASLFGAPLVGLMAEKLFHYDFNVLAVDRDVPIEISLKRAAALQRAMLIMTLFPWMLSFLCYTYLHLVFGREYDMNQERAESSALLSKNIAISNPDYLISVSNTG